MAYGLHLYTIKAYRTTQSFTRYRTRCRHAKFYRPKCSSGLNPQTQHNFCKHEFLGNFGSLHLPFQECCLLLQQNSTWIKIQSMFINCVCVTRNFNKFFSKKNFYFLLISKIFKSIFYFQQQKKIGKKCLKKTSSR